MSYENAILSKHKKLTTYLLEKLMDTQKILLLVKKFHSRN